MIRIAQVLNNNVALISLGDKRQAIVMGNGLAFQKHKGQTISEKSIEKIFYLDTQESQDNLNYLLKDVPINFVTTTFEIIAIAKNEFHFPVLDYVYITLSDHIYWACRKLDEGSFKPSLIPDMHQQYPQEYAIAQRALEIIRRNLNPNFPDFELRNIALHFINGHGDSTSDNFEEKTTESVNDIVQSILNKYHIKRTPENHSFYDRLMIHLQYLVDRLDKQNNDTSDFVTSLESQFKNNYPESLKIATEIYEELQHRLNLTLSESERLYFVIHIQRLIKK